MANTFLCFEMHLKDLALIRLLHLPVNESCIDSNRMGSLKWANRNMGWRWTLGVGGRLTIGGWCNLTGYEWVFGAQLSVLFVCGPRKLSVSKDHSQNGAQWCKVVACVSRFLLHKCTEDWEWEVRPVSKRQCKKAEDGKKLPSVNAPPSNEVWVDSLATAHRVFKLGVRGGGGGEVLQLTVVGKREQVVRCKWADVLGRRWMWVERTTK